MKTSILTGITALTLLFLPLLAHSQEPVDVSQEIMAANESLMTAIQDVNVDAIVGHYTEDARVMSPNFPLIDGIENIRGMWKATLEAGPLGLKAQTVTAEAYGNTAIEEGVYKIHAPDGQVVDDGKYIVIWKNVDGSWLVHRDIYNSNRPAPGTGM